MSLSVAQLNTIAQEIANKIGHISQELLLEVHALVHKDEAVAPTPEAASAETAVAPSTNA